MTTKQSTKLFKIIIGIIAIVPLITGVSDVIYGVASQLEFGMENTQTVSDPMLNSAYRFASAIWFGSGLLLLLFISDLEKYFTALMLLFTVFIIGGIGRIITILEVGFPKETSGFVIVMVAVVIELIIVPLLMLWLKNLKNSFNFK